jgi:uncharacterized integral membrane protein
MARLLYLVLLMVLVAAVAVFAGQNAGPVDIRFIIWGLSPPVAVVVIAAYVLGMVSGWTVLGIFRRSWRHVTAERQAR